MRREYLESLLLSFVEIVDLNAFLCGFIKLLEKLSLISPLTASKKNYLFLAISFLIFFCPLWACLISLGAPPLVGNVEYLCDFISFNMASYFIFLDTKLSKFINAN